MIKVKRQKPVEYNQQQKKTEKKGEEKKHETPTNQPPSSSIDTPNLENKNETQ